MSLLTELTTYRLCIPKPGKMFMSNISKTNQVLVYCINKGFFETDELEDMQYILNVCKSEKFVEVGSIEKVKLNEGEIVYRQRVFFKSFKEILDICKQNLVMVKFSKNFHFDINSVMNILEYLPALEKYAAEYNETIEEFLLNNFMIFMDLLLERYEMFSQYQLKARQLKEDRDWLAYIDRAPYVLSSYSIDDKTSAIFHLVGDDFADFESGFTTDNLKKDKKLGRI